jgi:hypothetical protein
VCVVDVSLPPTFADEWVRSALEARRRLPGVPVLVLSQYVEHTCVAELVSTAPAGSGSLLEDRVAEVRHFVEALRRAVRCTSPTSSASSD